MLALGIETATYMGGVSLVDDKIGIIAELAINSKSSHSERLLPMVNNLLNNTPKDLKECSCICTSIGPGSFTGIRIGLTTAKGLAFTLKKPIIGISTLETLAMGLRETSLPICTIIDARKKELFTSLYIWKKGTLLNLYPEKVISPMNLIKQIKQKTIFVGDAIFKYGEILKKELKDFAIFVPYSFNYPRASIVAEIGLKRLSQNKISEDVETITPVYIRKSEAELNWRNNSLS